MEEFNPALWKHELENIKPEKQELFDLIILYLQGGIAKPKKFDQKVRRWRYLSQRCEELEKKLRQLDPY